MRLSLFVVSVAVFVGSSKHANAAKLGARQLRTTPLLNGMSSLRTTGLCLTSYVSDFPGQAPLPTLTQHTTESGGNDTLLPLNNIQGDILYVLFSSVVSRCAANDRQGSE